MGSVVMNLGSVPGRGNRAAITFSCVCGLFLWLIACSAVFAQNGRWYPEDEPAPALLLKDVDGREYDLAALRGRVVIVNFWATWCGPCVAEMPSLQALAARLGDKNALVLGVNYHESAQKIRDFQARYRLNFPLLRDAWQEASGTWKVGVLPTTFIVDASGTLRWRVVGEVDWLSKAVAERLKQVQGRGKTGAGTTSAARMKAHLPASVG